MPPPNHRHTVHRFHHRLPSTLEGINEAIKHLTDFIKETDLQTNFFALVYLVREALNNAVIHGNKMSPKKNVQCDVQVEGSDISITIMDEGDGFHWQEVASRKPPKPDSPSGRGVYSLQQYGYSMHYNDKGNILYLNKEGNC